VQSHSYALHNTILLPIQCHTHPPCTSIRSTYRLVNMYIHTAIQTQHAPTYIQPCIHHLYTLLNTPFWLDPDHHFIGSPGVTITRYWCLLYLSASSSSSAYTSRRIIVTLHPSPTPPLQYNIYTVPPQTTHKSTKTLTLSPHCSGWGLRVRDTHHW